MGPLLENIIEKSSCVWVLIVASYSEFVQIMPLEAKIGPAPEFTCFT